jgi:hypothetical protein
MCDLDSNGRLSHEELSLHGSLTSDETLPDEEWKFIGETVGFVKGELTKESFMKLYILEGRQKDVDLEDIQSRLNNMGLNQGLKIDHSCPYIINIASEADNFEILLGEIYKLRSAEGFIFQLIESNKNTNKKKLKDLQDVTFYEYNNQFWSAIAIENKSRNDFDFEISCSKSENCLANVQTRDMKQDLKVKAMKNKLAMFVAPMNKNKEWHVRCSVGY